MYLCIFLCVYVCLCMHVFVINLVQTGTNGLVVIDTLCLHSWHTKEMHNPRRIGSAVPDNYYSSRSSSGRQCEMQDGLLMLFHCNITEPFHGQYVYDALGTTARLWPKWLYLRFPASDPPLEIAIPVRIHESLDSRTASCANALRKSRCALSHNLDSQRFGPST